MSPGVADMQAQTDEISRIDAALETASEESVAAATAQAQERLQACQTELDKASKEIDAAKAEVAGIETGDGRDEHGRSMPERLRDLEADVVRSLGIFETHVEAWINCRLQIAVFAASCCMSPSSCACLGAE